MFIRERRNVRDTLALLGSGERRVEVLADGNNLSLIKRAFH
jgi:hypothetical protein